MIEEIILNYFGVTKAQIMQKSRLVEFCRPRQVCMYFYRKYTKYSLERIAMMFNKDHATVVHSCAIINNLIDTEKEFAFKIKELDKFILQALSNDNVEIKSDPNFYPFVEHAL